MCKVSSTGGLTPLSIDGQRRIDIPTIQPQAAVSCANRLHRTDKYNLLTAQPEAPDW